MLRLALAALIVLLGGCPSPQPIVTPPGERLPLPEGTPAARSPELDAARERWTAMGYDIYRMTLHRSCFCPEDYRGPFEVTVRDGQVESVQFQGAPIDAERAVTVDNLFALLEDAYARGAESVRATYDPETGVPTELYIDYDARMADEEIGYTVGDLEAAER